MAVRHRAHHGLQGDPGANHHPSRANWVVLGTLLGQTMARIDFEGHFIALPPHGGGGGGQAGRGWSSRARIAFGHRESKNPVLYLAVASPTIL